MLIRTTTTSSSNAYLNLNIVQRDQVLARRAGIHPLAVFYEIDFSHRTAGLEKSRLVKPFDRVQAWKEQPSPTIPFAA
jgi:hypothetical protein